MRRAALSISSNIAEGCGRDGAAELPRFCTVARGPASPKFPRAVGASTGFSMGAN